jgi:hypothetical protein
MLSFVKNKIFKIATLSSLVAVALFLMHGNLQAQFRHSKKGTKSSQQMQRPLRIESSTGASLEHIPKTSILLQDKLTAKNHKPSSPANKSRPSAPNRLASSKPSSPSFTSSPPSPLAKAPEWDNKINQTLEDLNRAGDDIRNRGWRRNIVTTVFWIGQGRVIPTSATNYKSAWDRKWEGNYGGKDDPKNRAGFVPSDFAATLNPFYVALPFNDIAHPELARKWIPWWQNGLGRWVTQCKGRWVEIRNQKGESCFAQWEDVGPFVTDDAEYVFGTARPKAQNGAGLDVSPAVRDYLGLTGRDLTDWRFVEPHEVSPGPWIKYGEQAIIFSALKKKEEKIGRDATQKVPKPSKNQNRAQANSKIPSTLSEGL